MSARSWEKHLKEILLASAEFSEEILQKARDTVRRAHLELNPDLSWDDTLDIAISFDAAWIKRGHTSLFALIAFINILTGLVIDYVVLSKYCHMCAIQASRLGENTEEYKQWKTNHENSGECQVRLFGFFSIYKILIKLKY